MNAVGLPAVEELEDRAKDRAGVDAFEDQSYREGLDLLVSSLRDEADLTPLGADILTERVVTLLANRLAVEEEYRRHPAIAEQEVEGPIFIVGLPRTGTTALSQLVAADPQIRSLRLWESMQPVPPPTAGADGDSRIAAAEAGLELMYQAFPLMRSLYFQTATGPTECQDLLGMSFRTMHFDGMARVPAYRRWALDCDMTPAYRFHRATLRLLQWRCPPRLWHLKTPVHLLSLDALDEAYPEARFLWTHRDPAAVLGSVCSLVAYTRSWVSEEHDAMLGAEQVELWCEALHRGLEFRERSDEGRFADVYFGPLNTDPLATVEAAYSRVGLGFSKEAAEAMAAWSVAHRPGDHGTHRYRLEEFGLDAGEVRGRFGFYLDRFEVPLG